MNGTKNISESPAARISAHIAEELKREAVTDAINESLRQQFIKLTIPETANALEVAAAQVKKATAEFVRVVGALGDAYRVAAAEPRLDWVYGKWWHPPTLEVNRAPVVQSAPPFKPPPRPKARGLRC